MVKKGLRYCEKFADNPFLTHGFSVDISDIIMNLSKSSLELMYYLLSKKSFLDDKLIFNFADFKDFARKKSDTSAIRALGELCCSGIIAKTKMSGVYWINKEVFLVNKEMEFLEKFLKSKTKRNS